MNASRIGVWQTAFLGDLVLTLPLLQSLRRAFPTAHVRVFVRKGLAGVLAGHPEYPVTEFDKRGAQSGLAAAWSFGRALSRKRYGAWISPHTSVRSALVARAVNAPLRVGYRSPIWNRLAYTHLVDRSFGIGEETWRLAKLAEPLGVRRLDDWPELRPCPQTLAQVDGFWRQNGLAAPVAGLHPGTLWPTKRWPARSYAALLNKLADAGVRTLVFGGPGEEAIAREVLELASPKARKAALNLAGQLTIPELLAHIWKLSVYVANDSGPMHASWAMRTPTVALIGPTGGIGFDPRGDYAQMLTAPGVECRPCGTHGAKTCKLTHHHCMEKLTPELAWPAVERALEFGRGR